MTCKREICRLINAAWHDYQAGQLKMLRLPAEVEAVKHAVEYLKRGDRDLAEAECRKFAGSWSLWRLAMEEKQEEKGK